MSPFNRYRYAWAVDGALLVGDLDEGVMYRVAPSAKRRFELRIGELLVLDVSSYVADLLTQVCPVGPTSYYGAPLEGAPKVCLAALTGHVPSLPTLLAARLA